MLVQPQPPAPALPRSGRPGPQHVGLAQPNNVPPPPHGPLVGRSGGDIGPWCSPTHRFPGAQAVQPRVNEHQVTSLRSASPMPSQQRQPPQDSGAAQQFVQDMARPSGMPRSNSQAIMHCGPPQIPGMPPARGSAGAPLSPQNKAAAAPRGPPAAASPHGGSASFPIPGPQLLRHQSPAHNRPTAAPALQQPAAQQGVPRTSQLLTPKGMDPHGARASQPTPIRGANGPNYPAAAAATLFADLAGIETPPPCAATPHGDCSEEPSTGGGRPPPRVAAPALRGGSGAYAAPQSFAPPQRGPGEGAGCSSPRGPSPHYGRPSMHLSHQPPAQQAQWAAAPQLAANGGHHNGGQCTPLPPPCQQVGQDAREPAIPKEQNMAIYADEDRCSNDDIPGDIEPVRESAARKHCALGYLEPVERIKYSELKFTELLGAGEFGQVFRGQFAGAEVAIKQLFWDSSMKPEVVLRDLAKEIESFRHLRHKRLVCFVGACLELPNPCLVTEYMPGGSLHHLLHVRKLKLPLLHGINMCLQLADGVTYLHSQMPCVVHRDLKSQNIVLDLQLNIKLCDFGLTESMERTHIPKRNNGGSPRYMAPELFDCKTKITEKVDIWAMGCVFIEIFGGPLPYDGVNALAELTRVMLVSRKTPVLPKQLPDVLKCTLRSCHNFDHRLRPRARQVFDQMKESKKQLRQAGLL
eukprot:gnl/TRDRNA2_/TRDRNA2_137008_c0_seq1.p1 gnl/TRDRNA2_/TRDRNA2_137008_c0~~gnl/TRDRNA2_/TRDRNA2_137008_c0_seq1.p1  ORF type:complete len:692 (-),score=131.48 gnl/TRDRNA2_/TRDRNA2_137008_c0_seq1:150-2225(-)